MHKLSHKIILATLLILAGCTTQTTVPTETAMEKASTPPNLNKETAVTPPSTTPKTTLKRIKQEDEQVYYDGTITVSGTYTLYRADDPFLSGSLCFEADAETGYLIPREEQTYWAGNVEMDARSPWFCFENQAMAEQSFFSKQSLPNPKCNYGTATIEISNYVVTLLERESHDRATLEKVISKTPGEGC